MADTASYSGAMKTITPPPPGRQNPQRLRYKKAALRSLKRRRKQVARSNKKFEKTANLPRLTH